MIKIGDFGISRILMGTTDMASTFIGTPFYMSPEVLKHEGYNAKSDVWLVRQFYSMSFASLITNGVSRLMNATFHLFVFMFLNSNRNRVNLQKANIITIWININYSIMDDVLQSGLT